MVSALQTSAEAPGSHWKARSVTAAVLALLTAYYFWAVRATGSRFTWKYDLGGYYDLLARGFASGHLYVPIEPSPELLSLPDPWDPAANEPFRLQDMALFHRHYYLYFGAAPAVVLFLPWRLATGHDLPENFALFLLCWGGLLFSSAALVRLLRLANVTPSSLQLGLMLLALGICHPVPFLLNRSLVYEIAVGAGYFFVSAAMFCLVSSMHSLRPGTWMAAAGLLFGVATASRPHLALAGALASLLIGRRFGFRSREFTRFLAGFALIGFALGIYNQQRFGNPFEFGFRYQLAGPGQNRVDLSLAHLMPGLYFLLFRPPVFSPVFPWVYMVFRHAYEPLESLPRHYFYEPTVGALWLAPFLAALFFCRCSLSQERALKARFVLGVAATSAAVVLLFLSSTHLMSHRYEGDFVPLAVFAALGRLAIGRAGANLFRRCAVDALFGLAIAYGTVVNLALGIAGPYNDLLGNRPAAYARLAGWFSPFSEYRPLFNPDVRIAFRARFSFQENGSRELLTSIGRARQYWLLYVEHLSGALRLVSQTEQSRMHYDFVPPDDGVEFRIAYSGKTTLLMVRMNGRMVFEEPIPVLITAPAQVRIGESGIEPAITQRGFTGRIEVLERVVRENRPSAAPSAPTQ
jgi:hypothetical protein